MYRCIARSVEGFVQQLAVCYLRNGYFFYISGIIPLWKEPERTDRKIIEKYGLNISRFARARRKRRGIASIQYLRYGHFFVIAATSRTDPVFSAEWNIRDFRRTPLNFGGYSIYYGKEQKKDKWHPSVRIEKKWMRKIERHFKHAAARKSEEELISQLRALPFEPYAPVRHQILSILKKINLRRKSAGLFEISPLSLRARRRTIKPFAPPESLLVKGEAAT